MADIFDPTITKWADSARFEGKADMRSGKYMVIPVVLLIAACQNTGANYTPVIDGPVNPNYNYDLAQCRQLAASQPMLNGDTAMTSAATAGVAAAGTAVISNKGHNVRNAGLVGALAGVGASALQNNQNRESIIANCMRGRGYRVVG